MDTANATIEIINSRQGILTIQYSNGNFAALTITRPSNGALDVYELGYNRATVHADERGARLETYRKLK